MPTDIEKAEAKRIARTKFPRTGTVTAIWLRPEKGAPTVATESVDAVAGEGLTGDHYGKKGGSRQVSLIQAEHLAAIGDLLGDEPVDASRLRRNIVVRGINLLAFLKRRFRIGTVLLETTGPCTPCEQMEAELGEGGMNAMEGHGGLLARVIESGTIRVGDEVVPAGDSE